MNFLEKTKLFVLDRAKSAINFMLLTIVLLVAFRLGIEYGKRPVPEKPRNPYAHAFSPKEISIAVNESNELIMIERATGNYIVYSDTIGQTIFGMYANRIHQEINDAEQR